MDAMETVFGENPDRPNTPDLWRIAEVLLRHDGAVDDASKEDKREAWNGVVGGFVDIPTVKYMCEQRVQRVFGPMGQSLEELRVRATLVGLLIDAFVAGAGFEKAGGHRETW